LEYAFNLRNDNFTIGEMNRILFFCLFLSFGVAAQNLQKVDSLKTTLAKSQKPSDKGFASLELSKAYRWNNLDSARKYSRIAKNMSLRTSDKSLQSYALLMDGIVMHEQNKYDSCLAVFQLAKDGFTKLKDYGGIGRANDMIGKTYQRMASRNEVSFLTNKAIDFFKIAIENFEMIGDTLGLLDAYSNSGVAYRNLSDYKNAEASYLIGLRLAKEAGIENVRTGILHANYSQIKREVYKDYDHTITLLKRAIQIYEKTYSFLYLEGSYRNLAETYRLKKNFPLAIFYGQKAVDLAIANNNVYQASNAYDILYRAQADAGLYKEALESYRYSKITGDSLMSVEKTARIAEMEAKYETVKKDAEIAILNKSAELNRLRTRSLLIGIALILLTAASFFYYLRERRKREKLLEAEKLNLAEKELDFKKKELTTKVLQLAKKNEFLSTLKGEVESLKKSVGSSVNQTSNRISSMIRRDIEGDQQWERFSEEFTSIHEGFITALVNKYGSFTKSEMKLISLLKMNLSSKEIEDILGISDEGVKKARYRLRKKMDLEDSELQAFLLNFS
jgi:tetratricopeptide (TPR) repeat protein/DNA-binding CsgD family transcriptional regulator